MNVSRRETSVVRAGVAALVVFGALGVAQAASPTREHLDLCNKRAAEAATRTNKGSDPQRTGPMVTTDKMPDQRAPGSSQPGTPTNPTGGRITDSTQPGTPPSKTDGTVSPEVLKGMAPTGQSDPAYQQSYLVCMRQLGY